MPKPAQRHVLRSVPVSILPSISISMPRLSSILIQIPILRLIPTTILVLMLVLTPILVFKLVLMLIYSPTPIPRTMPVFALAFISKFYLKMPSLLEIEYFLQENLFINLKNHIIENGYIIIINSSRLTKVYLVYN